MKRVVLTGALVAAFAAAPIVIGAQSSAKQPAPPARGSSSDVAGAHAEPKAQPETAPAPTAPTGEVQLGAVHLNKSVKADGKPLPAGTYQLRLTAQAASPDAKGATEGLERWVEFMQRGQVKGREVATIIPQSEIDKVQKDTPPRPNSAKVQMLKGGDFVRVWVNKGGNHYLIYLPPNA
jgi:hypothetical protein